MARTNEIGTLCEGETSSRMIPEGTLKEQNLDSTVLSADNSPPMVRIPLLGATLPRRIMPWLLAGLGAILLLGWFFLSSLPKVWFSEEGYYSHGLLIPFMAIAVIYTRRNKIKAEPVSSSLIGFGVLILGLLLLLAARAIDNLSIAAVGFILALAGGVYFAFGKHIAKHIIGPIAFLTFMMPVLGWVIDTTTNPLQLISTKIAAKLLNIVGYQTDMSPTQPTLIQMNDYAMMVGGPCSGFKLILSLLAFSVFFIMLTNLGWIRNLIFIGLTLPLALFINGLRIMLVGVVGQGAKGTGIMASFGDWLVARGNGKDAGMVFHDYSGYITLIVCFIILHYIVKALEKGVKKPDAVPS